MIDKTIIFEITRLKNLDWSDRKIARHLRIRDKNLLSGR